MHFKKKRIREACNLNIYPIKTLSVSKLLTKNKKTIFMGIATILGLLLFFMLWYSSFSLLNGLGTAKILKPFSKDLKSSGDYTNILLLGTGTLDHEGSDLTDSTMIVSLNNDEKSISLLSLPRDLYAITELGEMRINQIYETSVKRNIPEKGKDILIRTIEKIIGEDIHYYAKINFDGFVQFIDAIGGIDVFIEQTIIDRSFPKGETFRYETFTLEEGLQHLDGATALKYARTRKCNICLDGDFGRARRQQQIINAVKEKAVSARTLLDPGKIKEMIEVASNNFETDLTLREILTLADFADDLNSEDIHGWIINDDPGQTGGFLYVPERKYYNGAFVLIPQTNPMGIKDENPYYEINDFADIVLKNAKTVKEERSVEIRNATRHSGLASGTFRYLVRYGFNPVYYGNDKEKNQEFTTIAYALDENSDTARLLNKMIPGRLEQQSLSENAKADIVITLGEDFYTFYKDHSEIFY